MTDSLSKHALVFQVFNEIGIINQLSSAQLSKALAPHLGQSEFSVLNHFVRVGDGASPSRLARIFQMSKPSMTAILSKLEGKGLAAIVGSEDDRRRKIVTITEKGRAERARAVQAIAPMAEAVASGFDTKQLKAILPHLTALREFLDAARNAEDDLNR